MSYLEAFPEYCHDLAFIADKMDFGRHKQTILKKHKIKTLDDLHEKCDELVQAMSKEREHTERKRYSELISISKYTEHLSQVHHGDDVSMAAIFSQNEFDQYKEGEQKAFEGALDNCCFGDEPLPKDFSDDDRSKYLKKRVPECLGKLSAKCLDELKKCHFGPDQFCELMLRSKIDGTRYIVVEGRTQLGKSNVKCIIHAFGVVSKTGIIVLTQGNSERDELLDKVKGQADDKTLFVNANSRAATIAEVLKMGGTVVANQTASQIQSKLIHVVQRCQRESANFRFAVVLDEGDTMFRSRDKQAARVMVEQAYRKLLNLKPFVVTMISATICPMLLHLVDKEELREEQGGAGKIQFRLLKPNSNYVSVDDFKPLEDENGEELFLDGTVRYNRGAGASVGNIGPIPYTDVEGKMIRLYDDAINAVSIDATHSGNVAESNIVIIDDSEDDSSSTEQGPPKRSKLRDNIRRGALLLDVTNERVNAIGNVFEKAGMIQDAFCAAYQKKLVVFVFVGSGIHVRREHGGEFQKEENGRKISDVIQSIDDDPRYGLETPIFGFGFSKMKRGMSFRSARRVPTHMVVSRGMGYSIEDMIQTFGRATYVGKDILQDNGFQHVTVLCPRNDLISATKYHTMTEFLQGRMLKGDNLYDALKGANQKIPDHGNALRHTNRKMGPGSMSNAPAKVIMQETGALQKTAFSDPSEADAHLIGRYWDNVHHQQLLGVIHRMVNQGCVIFDIRELRESYRSDYEEPLMAAKAKRMLAELCSSSILEKSKVDGDFFWEVRNEAVLEMLLNPHLSESHDVGPDPVLSF